MPEQRIYSRNVTRRAATLTRRFAFDEPAPVPAPAPEPEPIATSDEDPGVKITGTHPVHDELGGLYPHFVLRNDGTATRREDLAALLDAQAEPEDAPEPEQETPAGAMGWDAPHGMSLLVLENAARAFREAGYGDHDAIQGRTSEDGTLTRLVVSKRYATGGIIEAPAAAPHDAPGKPDPAVPAANRVVIHTAPPSMDDDLARGLRDMAARRLTAGRPSDPHRA